MKKVLFAIAALFGCITVINAQSTLVATLSHGSEISMFYGTNALKDALEKAESGDIINLSDGAFKAVNIDKAITLRGTGIDSPKPTYILNDFSIIIPADDTNQFTMEGIRCTGLLYLYGNLCDANFMRSQFHRIQVGNNTEDEKNNIMFANCRITDRAYIYYGSASFVNSYIKYFTMYDNASAILFNCITPSTSTFKNSHLYNTIIYSIPQKSTERISQSNLVYNCVAINFSNPFDNLVSSSSNSISTFEEVFKNFTGEYSDNQTFELTDAAKAKFLGTDGKQVGLYGGYLPYTTTPSYPTFSKMDVSGKTTSDGKLTVDIEVSSGK